MSLARNNLQQYGLIRQKSTTWKHDQSWWSYPFERLKLKMKRRRKSLGAIQKPRKPAVKKKQELKYWLGNNTLLWTSLRTEATVKGCSFQNGYGFICSNRGTKPFHRANCMYCKRWSKRDLDCRISCFLLCLVFEGGPMCEVSAIQHLCSYMD